MRIITGSAKGTKLKTPRGLETRPTADRVKESVFNILGDKVLDAQVLDLFAGTGNLGLESLSRGAKKAVFIDSNPISIQVIRENALQTKLQDQVEVYKNEALRALKKMIYTGRMFDLLFCDPPYNQGLVAAVLQLVDGAAVLSAKGVIVVEHSQHEPISSQWQSLQIRRTEKYGETLVNFLQHKDTNTGG